MARTIGAKLLIGLGCWMEGWADVLIRVGLHLLPSSETDGGLRSPEGAQSGNGGTPDGVQVMESDGVWPWGQ